MKKAVVVGGAGSVGSTLAFHLLEDDYMVDIVDPLLFGQDGLIPFMAKPVSTHPHFFQDKRLPNSIFEDADLIVLCFLDYDYMVRASGEIHQLIQDKLNSIPLDKCIAVTDWRRVPGWSHLLGPLISAGGTALELGCVYGSSFRVRFDTIINQAILQMSVSRHYDAPDDCRRWMPINSIHNIYEKFKKALSNRGTAWVGYDSIERVVELMLAVRDVVSVNEKLVGDSEQPITLGFGKDAGEFGDFEVSGVNVPVCAVNEGSVLIDEVNQMIAGILEQDDDILSDISSYPSAYYQQLQDFQDIFQQHGAIL